MVGRQRRLRRSLGWAGPVGAALALLAAAPPAVAVVGTELVSRAPGLGGAPADDSTNSVTVPAVSLNGRYVAFQSRATNFDPADTDGVYDIYVRDTLVGTTKLVSRAGGATGAKGNGNSDHPEISADGRYVAFASISSNLHPGDSDSLSDVFVRDLQTNTTTLVPRADGSHNFGTTPSISADGRLVAFDSQHAIYVRDLQAGTTILVSRATGASGAAGSSNSFSPSISPNGRYVAFESQSTNLDPADTSLDTDIYVRDTAANTTGLASRASGAGGVKANESSGEPSMSDAPSVAYESGATNLHPDDTGTSGFDIFVRDLAANTTTLASRANGAAGAKGSNGSRWPSISANGLRVAFESQATNLVVADSDGISDSFVRDLAAGGTTLASVANDGMKGNNASNLVALSPDGGFVAFESAASNLGANALARQIFIRALSGGGNPGGGGPGGGGGPAGGPVGVPGGSGGGGGGAGPTAPRKASFAASKRSIKVSKNGRFSFTFRAGAGLTGRVAFTSAKKVRIGAKRKKVTLVRKSFTVPASGKVKLKLKLSRKNLRILRKNRKVKTNVTVTLKNTNGLSSTARAAITLKRS
jgi:Tol biopolymer transport system component